MSLREGMLATLILAVAELFNATRASAGTTGGLSGIITASDNQAPVAKATVRITSASESSSTQTDDSGHYVFVSLVPGSYTLSVSKDEYEPLSTPGLTITADQTLAFDVKIRKIPRTIVTTRSRPGGLVKPGTTSDVYSVNAALQKVVAPLNGGNNLNSAYSAISSAPGVYMPPYQVGYGQAFFIRGADSDQVGYEYDGIPINRAFDFLPAGGLSNLGQKEIQIYTGGSPASANAPTVAGYINQVIKTGTNPGFATAEAGVGYPAFYHNLRIEAGGSDPNRTFSYYVGLSGYNQGFLQFNDRNGTNLSLQYPGLSYAATPYSYLGGGTNMQGIFPACESRAAPHGEVDIVDPYQLSAATVPSGRDPGCVAFAPGINAFGAPWSVSDREDIVNLHFAIPHKHDAGRDDVQLLYSDSAIAETVADAFEDAGGTGGFGAQIAGVCPLSGPNANCKQSFANPYNGGLVACSGNSYVCYPDTVTFPQGTTFGQPAAGITAVPYLFPLGGARAAGSPLPYNTRDTTTNNAAIFKVQYQKNIGTNAYVRLFGYTDYSDLNQVQPNAANNVSCYFAYPSLGCDAPDYELHSHTRGVSLQFADQISPKHLITGSVGYTAASTLRYNQLTVVQPSDYAPTNLVGSDGNCYAWTGGIVGGQSFARGARAPCFSDITAGTYSSPTQTGSLQCNAGGADAGTAGCLVHAQWIVTVPGGVGPLNTVFPVFTDYSLQDELRPNEKLLLNFGIRQENYVYRLSSVLSPEYDFWFKAARAEFCYDPATGLPVHPRSPPGSPPLPDQFIGFDCSLSEQRSAVHPNTAGRFYTNVMAAPTVESHILSPRFGFTYSLNSNTVIRGSAGLYSEPAASAWTQYVDASARSAAQTDFANFWGFGFVSPRHDIPTERSSNYDISLEQRLKGTQISYKLTPYYRLTLDQYEYFQGPDLFVSVAAGTQKSYGVEFQVTFGDPAVNGFSGQLSYTYTHATIQYQNTPTGFNGIDALNSFITQYNRLTRDGGGARCYNNALASSSNPDGVAPSGDCSIQNGSVVITPSALAAGDVINPYYLNQPQPTLDRDGRYPATDVASFTSVPAGYGAYSSPNVFSGFVTYKRNKLSITPSFMLEQGSQYGSPAEVVGEDPRTCTKNQSDIPTAPNHGLPNYITCGPALLNGSTLAIPNPLTGKFDAIGQYQQPWQLLTNLMVTYEVTPRIQFEFIAANIYNTCFGGSSTPWSAMFKPNAVYCQYGANPWYISNFYNGASPHDAAANGSAPFRFQLMPYGPSTIGQQPAQFTLTASVKL